MKLGLTSVLHYTGGGAQHGMAVQGADVKQLLPS